MKKITVILLAIALTGAYSCSKLKHIKFTNTFTAHLTVPANSVVDQETTVFSDDVSTDVQKVMNDNSTTKDAVNTIKAEDVTLVITAPDAQTWDYVKDIHIYLSAPNIKEAEVAFKQNINENGKELKLTVRDIELKDYFLSETFKIRATATLQKAITEDVKVDAKIRARFDANLLEALK